MANIFNNTPKEFEKNINARLAGIDYDAIARGQGGFPNSTVNSFEPDPIPNFGATNTSYSGTDCTVIVQANSTLIMLGNITTFSYSLHRDKVPIRVLGRTAAKGYVAGGRTVAGSLIFTVFDTHPLMSVIKSLEYIRNPEDRYTSPLPDQLPPLDFILIFHNEYGYSSIVRLYGVEFTDEGTTHSINDIYSEAIMQYVARDIDVMVAEKELKEFKDLLFARQVRGGFVDNFLSSMLDYKNRVIAQLEDVNTYINAIDIETGRRSFGGAFIIGGSMIAGAGAGGWTGAAIGAGTGTSVVLGTLLGKGTISRTELNNLKAMYLKKKKLLLDELEKINTQIRLYEQNIKGWNAQNASGGSAGVENKSADGGVAQFDNLKAGSATSAPSRQGRY